MSAIFSARRGHRRADGLLPRSDFLSAVLFSDGTACRGSAISAVTWLVAIGANLSALWILIANAWMQNPFGAEFKPGDDADGADFVLRFCSIPSRRTSSFHTVKPPVTSAARSSCWRSARSICCAAACRAGAPLADRRRQLRPRLGLVGRRARRRERLHRDNQPENEDRRYRGGLEDRAGAGEHHRLRPPDLATRTTRYAIDIRGSSVSSRRGSLGHTGRGDRGTGGGRQKRIANGLNAYRALQTLRQTPDDPGAKAGVRRGRERPRLRAAAAPPHRRHRQCHPGADRGPPPPTWCPTCRCCSGRSG